MTQPATDAATDLNQAAGGVDGLVERVSRGRASRSTRRSFLGRVGRAAVLIAGGPALATVLTRDAAEARVCGQSGVSPLCATFDCDATWGWCWYASGCCADGLLKKICDCCAPNTPNPVGYCPSGTRVLCVVESCGADPRLQVKAIRPLPERDPVLLSAALAREAYPDGVPIAVLGDAGSSVAAACAASLGRVVEGPVLLTGRDGLAAEAAETLAALGVEFVKVAGSLLPTSVDAALTAQGIAVERVGTSTDLSAFSAEVAAWSRRLTGTRRALVLLPEVAEAAAPAAAAVALLHRLPLLVGTAASLGEGLATPRPLRETFVVSADRADATAFPGGVPVVAGTPEGIAERLSTLLLELGGGPDVTVLADRDDVAVAPALGLLGAPVLLHGPDSLDGTRDFLFAHRDRMAVVRPAGPLTDSVRYELQSIVNEFEAHLLRGEAGEGLPVIPQPVSERPIGEARR